MIVAAIILVLTFTLIGSHAMIDVAGQSSTAITLNWVDQQLPVWHQSQNKSLGFGVLFQPASYDNIENSWNPPAVENSTLAMLVSTGSSCVRIDIGYDAWLKNNVAIQTEMSSLVNQIRSDNKCLIIADASAESYRNGGGLPWTQFQQAWIQRVHTLASIFHPDYYIVIKEPGWYVPMVTDAATNPDFQNLSNWVNLTQTLAATVESASPSTKVGISIAADSLSSLPSGYIPYLTEVENLSSVSFIGFDIYTITGFQNTQSFLNQYGAGGKGVWIAECWSGDGSGIFDSSRSTLDTSWIQLVYEFAQVIGAQMIIPFYTDLFASYSFSSTSPTSSSQVLSLLQQRMPIYYEFTNIASKYGLTISTGFSSTSSTTFNTPSQSTSGQSTSITSSSHETGTGSEQTSSLQSTSSLPVSSTPSASSTVQPSHHFPTILVAGLGLIVIMVVGTITLIAVRRRR